MFQDLPPVKGSVEPSALPMPAGRDSAEGSEVDALAPLLILVPRGGMAWPGGRSRRRSCAASRPTSSPLVEADGVHAGADARAALQVTLPDGFHVQSNKPRDPHLIPTDADDRRAGRRDGRRDRLPGDRSMSKQVGADQPLAVFERTFAIGVRLTRREHGRARRAHGARPSCAIRRATTRRASRRRRRTAEWTLRVVPASAAVAAAHRRRLRHGSRSATASAPGSRRPQPPHPSRPRQRTRRRRRARARSTTSRIAGHDRRLPRHERLPEVHSQRRERRARTRGLFEGRGPLAILLLVFLGGLALNLTPCVLPMIPINLAIIGAGSQAGSRGRGFLLGGAYGAAMASSTACSASSSS